jgi:hypothetical protein
LLAVIFIVTLTKSSAGSRSYAVNGMLSAIDEMMDCSEVSVGELFLIMVSATAIYLRSPNTMTKTDN